MPGFQLPKFLPNWLRDDQASVMEPWWQTVARKGANLLGANDPAGQVMGIGGPMMAAETKLAGPLGKLITKAAEKIKPAVLKQGVQGEAGYAYHATNADRLHEIAESGKLRTHGPSYGTDQRNWPDLSTEKRAYFGASPEHLYQFAPEDGAAAVVRTKRDGRIFRESTGDLYSKKAIEARDLEFLGEDNQWHPLSSLGAIVPFLNREPTTPRYQLEQLLQERGAVGPQQPEPVPPPSPQAAALGTRLAGRGVALDAGRGNWQPPAGRGAPPPTAVPEAGFQQYYQGWAGPNRMNRNADDPAHHYDYRAAYRQGVRPPEPGKHWPSPSKDQGHPDIVVGGFHTQTGERVPGTPRASESELVGLGWTPEAAARLAKAPEPPPPSPVVEALGQRLQRDRQQMY